MVVRFKFVGFCVMSLCLLLSCGSPDPGKAAGEVRFLILAPGHFHAALVQKNMYDGVSADVRVYAATGGELDDYLARVSGFNRRQENPTAWNVTVYQADDFLEKMIREKKGNVVVVAGNNRHKTRYLNACVAAGLHVFSDKPMCIDVAGFDLLKKTFSLAERKRVVLYDIMTERYEITTILQKELAANREVFGDFQTGTAEQPAVTKESVHHFFKYVAGEPVKRPAWYFDESQQGEGIVDVTTHLVDLVQWECFPEEIIDYTTDIDILQARRWPTLLTPSQFELVTGLPEMPEFLKSKRNQQMLLPVFANGEIMYTLRNIHVKISVRWDFQAPAGSGDTHLSVFRGSRSNLVIRQGEEQQFRPELYVEVSHHHTTPLAEAALIQAVSGLQGKYPGVSLRKVKSGWQVVIPDRYRTGHEAHFGEVTEKYLRYLRAGGLPAWEVPNILAKYYVTTTAREMALGNPPQN